ncbi:hypothetical protein K2P97_06955 [bacterium]|nr:hypothetical protein [bacterium]
MKILKLLSLIAILIAVSLNAKAEILFEGYYKVTQAKKHIGFAVLRHEIEDKTNNFKTTSFVRLANGGHDFTESFQAISTGDLAPLSINYLAAGERKTKTIDAKFKDQKMTGTTVEDGKKIKINEKIPKRAFLSSALYYLMLKSKDGLKTGTKFDYIAITEEGPVAMKGTVSVDKKMITQGSLQLLKITNLFAGSDYINLVTNRGEAVSANTPATGIETELVKAKEEALEGIKLASGTLEKIFGDLPAGKVNVYQSKGK